MTKESEQANGLDLALRNLVEAIAQRQIEGICTSYLALRQQANGMAVEELLDHLERQAGGEATGLVVSAFSHRHCFMCKDGTTGCQTCDGTGMVDRFPCPQCEGLSLEPCSFCLGSAWTDGDEIPAEFRRAALKNHAARVEKDIARLAKLAPESWASAQHLAPEKKAEVVSWLLRLQGRLAELARSARGNGHDSAARYRAIADRVGRLLESLRVKTAGPRHGD